MATVEEFIELFEDEQKTILLYFHNYFTKELNLTPKIRFKIPFYYKKSWILYLNPTKSRTIELAFVRGNELSNSNNLLDSKGRKQVYSIEIDELKNIPLELLNKDIQEAILLDKIKPYESKRKIKNN